MKMAAVRDFAMMPVSLRMAWHECGDGVDNDDVDGAAAHKCIDDVECLLARIWLGDQEIIDVDAELGGIDRVERVLGIDEGRDAAVLLCFGDHVQRDRRLTGRLRAVDLDDAAARDTAYTEGDVERQDARRDDLDVHVCLGIAEAHNRTLAEVLLDLLQRILERFLFTCCFFLICCHVVLSFHDNPS